MQPADPITDAALEQLDRLHARRQHFTDPGEEASAGLSFIDTYPALRERMRLAEAERDHHQLLREELMEQVHELKDELHCALYCLELNGIADDGVREKLAARDARMKREGAIEAFEEMRRQANEVGAQSGLAQKLCKIFADECIEQAALLRGGE